MDTATRIDRTLQGAIAAILGLSVALHFWDPIFFTEGYAYEDGPVEYGTALCLLASSLLLLANAGALAGRGLRLAAVLTAIYGLVFFFGAGEEISWGQRIFGWESSDFFKQNNKQMETNLHNLVVGDQALSRTVFGKGLTAVVLLYLVALPLLYPRVAIIRRLADKLAIPVPGLRHTIAALASSIVIAVIDQNRKWEVYELIFSIVMVSVFLLPQNRHKTR
ncbi:MAG: hypothetical protein RIG84_18995 [Roseovarius sp.]